MTPFVGLLSGAIGHDAPNRLSLLLLQRLHHRQIALLLFFDVPAIVEDFLKAEGKSFHGAAAFDAGVPAIRAGSAAMACVGSINVSISCCRNWLMPSMQAMASSIFGDAPLT